MSATWPLSNTVIVDADGDPINAVAYFYDTGTSTPRTVYTDSALSVAHTQPVEVDSDYRFPVVFVPTGIYRYVVKTAAGVTLFENDDQDPGVATTGGGTVPVANGGTGATTASGARSNLGAAAAADVTTIAADLTTAESDIAALDTRLDNAETDIDKLELIVGTESIGGTRLGYLAGEDTLARSKLVSGFGNVVLQTVRAEVTAYTTCSTTIPFDDTIPQNTEGTSVFSQSITPVESSSYIEATIVLMVGGSAELSGTVALFIDSGVDAVAAEGFYVRASTTSHSVTLNYRYTNSNTTAKTFAVRVGASAGNVYLNGDGTARRFGGVAVSSLTLREVKAY